MAAVDVAPMLDAEDNPPNRPALALVPPRLKVGKVVPAPPSEKVAGLGCAAPNKPLVPGLTVCKLLRDNTLGAVVAVFDDPNLKAPVDAAGVCPNPPKVAGFDVDKPPKVSPVEGVDNVFVFGVPNEMVDGFDAEKALVVPLGVPKANPVVAEVPIPVALF